MHIVVIGCGRVGSGLANRLEEQGHDVAIVDRNERSFRRLGDFGGVRIVGQGFDHETLTEAGTGDAKAFAAVTSGDNSNILAARIAKESFQVPSVVARIYDPRRAEIYRRLGIATVATVAWTTEQVSRQLLGTHAIDWTDQSGSLHLVQQQLPRSLAGRPIRLAGGARVVAVSRSGVARPLDDGFIAQEGDTLHVLVSSAQLESLDSLFDTTGSH